MILIVDVRISGKEYMQGCFVQGTFTAFGLRDDVVIRKKIFSLLKRMKKAPEGLEEVLPKLLTLKLSCCLIQSGKGRAARPIWQLQNY